MAGFAVAVLFIASSNVTMTFVVVGIPVDPLGGLRPVTDGARESIVNPGVTANARFRRIGDRDVHVGRGVQNGD